MRRGILGMPTCPNASNHTAHPTSYLGHYEWAQEMAKTHVQKRCPGCGRWTIWVPKEARR